MNGTSDARARASESRYAQAAGWYLRIREAQTEGPDLSPEEILEWDRFHARPENRDALDLALRVSGRVSHQRAQLWRTSKPRVHDGYDPSISVEEWLTQRRDKQATSEQTRRWRPRSLKGGLLAAGLAVLALGVTQMSLHDLQTPHQVRTLSTAAGEHKQVTLADGSKMTLGGRTEVSIEYDGERRAIGLVDGEAVFVVAQDKQRPFTVLAGTGAITALGTQFDVRRDLDRVTVTVTEGTVLVEPSDALTKLRAKVPTSRWLPVRLTRGQELTYGGEKRQAISVERADFAGTEWTAGRLQYRDVPLKYVVADVNRYQDEEIVLQDSAAALYRFSGTVFRDRISEWARSLEKIFPVDVRQDGARIVIQCRPSPGTNTLCGGTD